MTTGNGNGPTQNGKETEMTIDHGVQIKTINQAKGYINALFVNEMDFHFDDDPREVINYGTGERIFSDQEAEEIDRRIREMFALEWGKYKCPIGYLLHLRGD